MAPSIPFIDITMALTENEVPVLVSLAGNQMWADYSTDETDEDFIGIHYKVFAYLNGEWTLQGKELRHVPDAGGKTIIDIHSLLSWDPDKQFAWKESPENLIHKRNDLRRLYRIDVEEKYGNPLATGDSVTGSSKYVLPGKIADLKQGIYNNQSTDWWDELQSGKSFLTNSPRIKNTDAWTSERLSYYVFGAEVTSIELMIKVYYSDESYTTIIRETKDSVVQHDVYEIITSFSTLGIYFLDPSKSITKYEIWLRDQSQNVISEVFTFSLDHERHEDARYFLFSNGYKVIEGARLTGLSRSQVKTDQMDLNRYLEKNFGPRDKTTVKAQASEVEYREASSGWLKGEEFDWLREILLSKEVYEIVKGEVVPVVIESGSFPRHEDNSNLRSITISYRYAHADSVPAVLPDLEDILDNFHESMIDIGGLINGPAGKEFSELQYINATGSFTAGTQDTDYPHAYSNNDLSKPNIPLLAAYWDLETTYDFCDLEMLLLEISEYSQVSTATVPLIWNEELGYGILISSNTDFRFGIRGIDGGANNGHVAFIRLYIPTKRCLEYLYEKGL